jgi:hypothetical protein
MFARNVSFRLKSNMFSDYTRTFENEILPPPQQNLWVDSGSGSRPSV